jgi:hypothetical protein
MGCSGSGSGSLSAAVCSRHLGGEELLLAKIDFPYSVFYSNWSSANVKNFKEIVLQTWFKVGGGGGA